jgi:hypothetical protein
VVLLTIAAGRLQAQTQITGALVDTASGKPLSGVDVFFYHQPTGQHSGKDGKFKVKAATVQDTVLIFRRSGYVPIQTSLSGTTGDNVDLGTLYLRPISGEADQVAVDAFELLVYPQLTGFYRHRREIPQAVFFTRDDILRLTGRQVSEVLRRTRALQNLCLKNRQGDVDCGEVAKRGTTYSGFRPGLTGGGPCALEYYLDGQRGRQSVDDLEIGEVIAIEVYPQASLPPREFSDGRCGAVAVWTIRSR